MAYKASGAAYANRMASIYPTFGNPRRKGSSSGRRGDTGMSSDPRMSTNDIDGRWQLPVIRCTTLGTADIPTVSSPGRGDQLHREWRSLPSSLRLALDGQAAARRKGVAAEFPGWAPSGKGI